jgi:hypothetical protein
MYCRNGFAFIPVLFYSANEPEYDIASYRYRVF